MFKATDYLISIVELPSFLQDAERIFTEDERSRLADFLAANPHFGDVIPGTGGIRKVRWGAKGMGKRGGARVIYYFRDLNMPVFLLAVYTKGEKSNLTAGQKEVLKNMVGILVDQYRPRWERIVQLSTQIG